MVIIYLIFMHGRIIFKRVGIILFNCYYRRARPVTLPEQYDNVHNLSKHVNTQYISMK